MNGNRYKGMGLKNICTRVEYLKGTVDIDSRPGNGTLLAIHVPLHKAGQILFNTLTKTIHTGSLSEVV